jgi:hypothetical protein
MAPDGIATDFFFVKIFVFEISKSILHIKTSFIGSKKLKSTNKTNMDNSVSNQKHKGQFSWGLSANMKLGGSY